MDDNKPGRRWLSFGIRDLLWLVGVIGLVICWWQDHSYLALKVDRASDAIGEWEIGSTIGHSGDPEATLDEVRYTYSGGTVETFDYKNNVRL